MTRQFEDGFLQKRCCFIRSPRKTLSSNQQEFQLGVLAVQTVSRLFRAPNWLARVNAPQSEAELEARRRAANRGQPFGDPAWRDKMSRQFGPESTFRPRGRPRHQAHDDKNDS